MSLDLYLLDESASLAAALRIPGVTDDQVAAWKLAWALDYQLRYQFGRSGWRSDVRCHLLPKGAPVPAGGAILHLVDAISVQGALGYHDEDGNEIPYAQIGVQTTLQDGGSVSEVASHEALELAADPHVNLTAINPPQNRLYAVEVGDPVQSTGYDVGEPDGRPVGVQVANFATPAYFDPNTKSERVDYRGTLSAPFTIGPQGYMSYLDLSNPSAGWQQQVGAERTAPPLPDLDDRLRQRGQLSLAR